MACWWFVRCSRARVRHLFFLSEEDDLTLRGDLEEEGHDRLRSRGVGVHCDIVEDQRTGVVALGQVVG